MQENTPQNSPFFRNKTDRIDGIRHIFVRQIVASRFEAVHYRALSAYSFRSNSAAGETKPRIALPLSTKIIVTLDGTYVSYM